MVEYLAQLSAVIFKAFFSHENSNLLSYCINLSIVTPFLLLSVVL